SSDEEAAGITIDRSPLTLIERSRSALWPLALALIVGVAIGFAGGYGSSFRDRTGPPAPAIEPPATAAAAQAREYTDNAVREAPKTAKTMTPPTTRAAEPATSTAAPARRPATPPESVARTAPPAPRGLGRVLVRSTPAGARVAVDGREYGVTPVAIRDLAVGTHAIRVSRDGYSAEERRVRITRSRPSQSMIVTLERPRASASAIFTGVLSVDSRPAGARVYLDGRLVGTTPLQSPASAGEHAIRLERDGYRRWTSAIRILSNEQNRVTASLER
ncbi:MAG TPA: PEGA domain-containing protein, partial [Vicinamibacterales bacterium]|nr:PEGA domain-containing protein [Vicinamibacterales bacterium]